MYFKMKKLCSIEKILCYVVSAFIVCAVILVVVIVSTTEKKSFTNKTPLWAYKCESNKCVKVKYNVETAGNMKGFAWCRQTCLNSDDINVWPSVQQLRTADSKYIKIKSIKFRENNSKNVGNRFWEDNSDRFFRQLDKKKSKLVELSDGESNVIIDINVHSENTNLTMGTDESYSLQASEESGSVRISIASESIFGARYALETLIQTIFYDDLSNTFVIRCGITIVDSPVYKHRGICLDTSRNFFSKESIKRNIDAMAMVKLNVFHWHITDSHSWPMPIKSHSYLSDYGAYGESKIYTADDISEIVNYAYNCGVRFIPELDAPPAHVGEGWQFTDLLTCFNIQPWQDFCYEPPCGQFNPTIDHLYDVLDDIYREMNEMFHYPDLFHMGGVELHFKCWGSSDNLTNWMINRGWNLDDDGYMRLWSYFQNKAVERLDKWARNNTTIILFTSTLTEPDNLHYLDNERYVIQVWSNLDDPSVLNLLENNFKIIVSNSDVMYLDCGYESWVATGNNRCSPYSGWQDIYANDFKAFETYKSQILGAEVLLWSEQADDVTLDGRLWPRGIALSERLWSDPSVTYREIEPKILLQRQRFVENGISSERLQPEWCLQNQGDCPLLI